MCNDDDYVLSSLQPCRYHLFFPTSPFTILHPWLLLQFILVVKWISGSFTLSTASSSANRYLSSIPHVFIQGYNFKIPVSIHHHLSFNLQWKESKRHHFWQTIEQTYVLVTSVDFIFPTWMDRPFIFESFWWTWRMTGRLLDSDPFLISTWVGVSMIQRS